MTLSMSLDRILFKVPKRSPSSSRKVSSKMHVPRRGLAELEPEGLPIEGTGWQQRKSAEARVAIMEATIDCLQRCGYARTSIQLIAQTAGISRGAMLHHYATKLDLISAVIDYVFYKRMENFALQVRRLTLEQRIHQQAGLEIFWESLQSREYAAFLELAIASRGDPALQEVFQPKAKRYDEVWNLEMAREFPEWKDKESELQLCSDLVRASFEGLLLNRLTWDSDTRQKRLRSLVAYVVRAVREGRLCTP